MLRKEDVVLNFRSKIDASYYNELERIFFFNWNQSRYADRITQSVEDYSKPIIVEEGDQIALGFRDRTIGQALHIFDSVSDDAKLIGVVMYERDNREQITIVHLVLHERCRRIFKEEKVNIAALIIKKLFSIFRRIKGINRVRIYYINKEVSLKREHFAQPIH